MQPWIGVDLDGTLAHYDTWVDDLHIGPPIAPMVDRVKAWLAQGLDVRIFTARAAGGGKARAEPEKIRLAIEFWCLTHIGRKLPITATKDYGMTVLYDDRAMQVEKNTGRLIGVE